MLRRIHRGLGFEFAAEEKRTFARIEAFPDAWTPLSARTRRCLTRRFPYAIVYQVRQACILVVAIQNMHEAPESWKERYASP